MQPVESFDQLESWQKTHALTLEIYKESAKLPEEEEFGLILQMRQAATRVPACIADGFSRRSMGSKLALYRDSLAALETLRYYLILCRDLGYGIDHETLIPRAQGLIPLVTGLVRSVARRAHGEQDQGRGRGRRRRGRGRFGGDDRYDREGAPEREQGQEPMDLADDEPPPAEEHAGEQGAAPDQPQEHQ
jgi:four helix bundle protein